MKQQNQKKKRGRPFKPKFRIQSHLIRDLQEDLRAISLNHLNHQKSLKYYDDQEKTQQDKGQSNDPDYFKKFYINITKVKRQEQRALHDNHNNDTE